MKDAVLMATVSSFEGLRQPRPSDLKQFCELFEPLFTASSDEARRQAAAALARSPHVPPSVALQIGSAPIAIAALFLTRAVSIEERVLLDIIRHQSPSHANAIARRDNLSVRVVDALVERRDSTSRPASSMAEPAKPAPATAGASLEREERLRAELKALARTAGQPLAAAATPPRRPLLALDATHEALLVRFSRSGEVNLFAATLSHALDCSAVFGERLVLDVSGWQLAVTLSALGTPRVEMVRMLTTLYPYLGERSGAGTRCDALLDGIDPVDAKTRVEGWIAADDARRNGTQRHTPMLGPERAEDPRQPAAYPAPANQTQQVASTFYRRNLTRSAR
ncbi:hypothetical protein G8E10_23215 [Rhizobiaceae bacterium CRRU44]|uniref:DUF2336 domain-containing protein n=1 Tax=Ferranicluibacter rubi TaxID=2715133 RepID=A0AA43ZIQ2_9HYPH|nr:hypothetical protein [Ferranicluibacter rubi]NHT78613.1 hypothetical protein [Ferranicluibacter rubi]